MTAATISYLEFLHVCLLRKHHLPVEFREIIIRFARYHYEITNRNIKHAVHTYMSSFKLKDNIYKMFGPIEWWDTSKVTNMHGLFFNQRTFNLDISRWDVSNVENMSWMFSSAIRFNQPIGNWDVSKVENMSYMFEDASSFNQPIGSWNVMQVSNMTGMFSFASEFNQSLTEWKAPKVTSTHEMFECAYAFDLDSYKPDFYTEEERFKVNIVSNRDIVIEYQECLEDYLPMAQPFVLSKF